MRALTAEQTALLAARIVRPVWFVELSMDPIQRFCSDQTTLEWQGYPWLGLGKIARIEFVNESTELEIQSVKLGLSGVPVEIIALVEAEPIKGKLCKVWTALYRDDCKIEGDPLLEHSGRLDVPVNRESEADESGLIVCDLTLTVENLFAYGLRPKIRRRTDADHQSLYPTDTIFRHVGNLSAAKGWGR